MTQLLGYILAKTGYRFPKDVGLFSRGSLSRELLRMIGISCVACNVRADFIN